MEGEHFFLICVFHLNANSVMSSSPEMDDCFKSDVFSSSSQCSSYGNSAVLDPTELSQLQVNGSHHHLITVLPVCFSSALRDSTSY